MAFAGSVARINQYRQMTPPLYRGNNGKIKRVARKVGERANASFAQHYVVVSFGQYIFRSHQKFVERCRHATLQQYRLFSAASALEQRKILHVARADLDYVRVLLDQVQRFMVNRLGNDAESDFFADLRQNLQARFAEPLKAVR